MRAALVCALACAPVAWAVGLNAVTTVAGIPYGGGSVKAPSSVSVSPLGTPYFITSNVFVASLTASQTLLRLAGGGAKWPPPSAAYLATQLSLPPLLATAIGPAGTFFALSKSALYAVDASGSLTTLVRGDGTQKADPAYPGGASSTPALPIRLGSQPGSPQTLAVHPTTGQVHVLEYYAIYKVDTTTTPAQPMWSPVVCGVGAPMPSTYGQPDGTVASSCSGLGYISGMAFSAAGDLYLAETSTHAIRVVWGPAHANAGKMYLFAGFGSNGATSTAPGPGSAAPVPATAGYLNTPTAVAVAANGDVFIADAGNSAVRRVSGGIMTTYAYSALAPGSSGAVGTAIPGILSFTPTSLAAAPGGNVYITALGIDSLLYVNALTGATGSTPTLRNASASPVTFALAAAFTTPKDIKLDSSDGSMLVADSKGFAVRRVQASTGLVSTIAGGASLGSAVAATNGGDGGLASAAFVSPTRLAVAANGDVFILGDCLTAPTCVRLVSKATGIITTVVARSPSWSSNGGDSGSALNATLSTTASGLAVTSDGTLLISDTGAHAIRCVKTAATPASSTISTCIGQHGQRGDSSSGGGAFNGANANAITLHNPRGIAVHEISAMGASMSTVRVYVCDGYNYQVFYAELDRGTLQGAVTVVAGSSSSAYYDYFGGTPVLVANGDGYSATSSSCKLAGPVDVAVAGTSATPEVYILDVIAGSGGAVRKVDALGTITTVVGDMRRPVVLPTGDGGPAAAATFVSPEALAISSDTRPDVLVCDSTSNNVRMAFFSDVTKCPAGFSCATGRDPQPCLATTAFCPANAAAPFPTDPGFYTVTAAAGFPGSPLLSRGQAQCSIGSYCAGGASIKCPGGTYGTLPLQSLASDCTPCAAGSYTGLTGSTSSAACLACPPGSYAAAPGSTFCELCPAGTALPTTGATSASACAPCAPDTTSLPGASTCFPSAPSDALLQSPGTLTFQRSLAVGDGNASPGAQTSLILRSAVPIIGVAILPYLLYILISAGCSAARCWALFEKMDMYTIEEPEEKGESPKFNPTPLGGTLTMLTAGGVVTLMVTSVVSFSVANTLLVQSTLTLTPATQAAFAALPLTPTSVLAGLPSAYDAVLAALLPSSRAQGGVTVTVRTQGALCASPLPNGTSWGLASGAFTLASASDAATGAAVHTLTCPTCFFSPVSYLTLSFDGSCQAYSLSVAAVGVAGGVTTSTALIAPPALPASGAGAAAAAAGAAPAAATLTAASITVPLSLEVIQDSVKGAARDDGLVVGGRSAAGLVAGAVTAITPTLATPATATAARAPVAITVYLPLSSVYAQNTLTPIMSLVGLASACAAWLGLLGIGGTLKSFHRKAGARLAGGKAEAGVAPTAGKEGAGEEAQGPQKPQGPQGPQEVDAGHMKMEAAIAEALAVQMGPTPAAASAAAAEK